MSGATFNPTTVMHGSITIFIIIIIIFIGSVIGKISGKSEGAVNYRKNFKNNLSKVKIPTKEKARKKLNHLLEKIKNLLPGISQIGAGIGAGIGAIIALLNTLNVIDIDELFPSSTWIFGILLGGISGLLLGNPLKSAFNPKGPYLWHTIIISFFILLFTIISLYSKELNSVLSPSKYKNTSFINRILVILFTLIVFAAIITAIFMWFKQPSKHAEGNTDFPSGETATFTSQSGWLLKEMKNYLFVLCGVGLIAFILFLILLFSFTNKGATYAPYIIMFVSFVIGGAALYLFLKTTGKPILDKIKSFPLFKLIYHILFLIPCFFLDIINMLYTEFKATPKIAYTLFSAEMIIILAVIAGPLITNFLYKNHPNTNIKEMKHTLSLQKNALDESQLKNREKIKELKRYGVFKKNWLSNGSKYWNKLLEKKWYRLDSDDGVTMIDGTGINSNFVNSFRINFGNDNDELKTHWIYVAGNDQTGEKGAVDKIIDLQLEITKLESDKTKIDKELLNDNGYAITKVLKMQPININHMNLISTYKDIYSNGSLPSSIYAKGNSDYALSFWTFFHNTPTESCIDKYYKIISYGNKPGIYFNPIKRKLAITLGIEKTCESEDCIKGNRIGESNKDGLGSGLYKSEAIYVNGSKQQIIGIIKNIKLQRWNNLVINCNNGVLDIFINGKLNGSYNINFRNNPFLENDTITTGEKNGLDGGICNIVFFSTHVSKIKIKTLYDSLKNKDPPIIFDLDTFFK